MLTIVLIIAIGLAPALLSLWGLQQEGKRAIQRLQGVREGRFRPSSLPTDCYYPDRYYPDRHYVEGLGYMIGDLTCQFNACSSYLRCAVNPMGDCKICAQYWPLEDWPLED